jgi:hypothetical protein
MNILNIIWFIFLSVVFVLNIILFVLIFLNNKEQKINDKIFSKNYHDWFLQKYKK